MRTHPTNIRRCVQCVKAWKREFYWHLLLNRDMPEKLLFEIGRGIRMNHDITPYLKDGYDEEQLKEINDAFEAGVNLLPYIRKKFSWGSAS